MGNKEVIQNKKNRKPYFLTAAIILFAILIAVLFVVFGVKSSLNGDSSSFSKSLILIALAIAFFLAYGIFLYVKSLKFSSTILKLSVLFPLLYFALLIVSFIFAGIVFIFLLPVGLLISIISITFSIISIFKLNRKLLPIGAILYNLILIAMIIFIGSNVTM